MKNLLCVNRLSKTVLAIGTLLLLITLSSNYALDWWPFGSQTDKSSVPVTIDPSPLKPELKANTSIASMIKTVAPSVVNVFSTKIARQSNELQFMPFFNDPFFRHFFGDQGGPSPQWQPQDRKQQSLGSGVIVTGDGYILTNNHVVEGADEVKISLADNKKEYRAKVIGSDPKTDIAILKVDTHDLPAITFADSDTAEVGDFVVAIGNPFGVGQTVTSGIISAVGRGNVGITDYEDFIQTDASINPGNSGGALVDAQGRLLGVNTAILSRSGGNQGIGFAVPINLAKSVMERILKHGRVIRGFLGVMIQDITPEIAEAFNLTDTQGVLIGEVTAGSAGEEAGIEKGDVILEFNDKKVKNTRALRLMVARTAPGTEVIIKVNRNGEIIDLKAILKELPGSEIAATAGNTGDNAEGGELFSGVSVENINPHIRQQLNVPNDIKGALIRSVRADSPAFDAGLRKGDIILEINRLPIKNAEEAITIGRNTKEKTALLYIWSNGGKRYVVIKDKES